MTERGDEGPPELGAQVVHGAGKSGPRNLARALGDAAVARIPRVPSALAIAGGRLVPIDSLAGNGNAPWMVEERITADPGPAPGSVAGWLACARPGRGVDRRIAAEWFRQNWAAEPADLSARGIAVARRGESSFGRGAFGPLDGLSELPRRLAAGKLDVRLGQAVRRVRGRSGGAELWVSGRGRRAEVHATRAVVVTAPPPVVAAGRLVIEDLPAVKLAAAQALVLGDGYCVLATLDRSAPDTAEVFDADGRGGFIRSYAGRPQVLVVAKADAAAAVRAAVATDGLPSLLAAALPWATGARVLGTEIADWGADQWITGAFTFPPGPRDPAGRRQPGPARWTASLVLHSGEATWAQGMPQVQGAMASGERAAREVLSASRPAKEAIRAEEHV